MKKVVISVLLVMQFWGGVAFAAPYKECNENTSRLWVGDDGFLWMFFKDGGLAYIKPNDPDFNNILSVTLAAHLAGKTITIRYEDPEATCADQNVRTDVLGIWLN